MIFVFTWNDRLMGEGEISLICNCETKDDPEIVEVLNWLDGLGITSYQFKEGVETYDAPVSLLVWLNKNQHMIAKIKWHDGYVEAD